MGFYVGPDGYFEGDSPPDAVEVSQRPDSVHKWDGTAWVVDTDAVKASAAAEIDRLERLHQMPKMLRITIILQAEREAIAAGAAMTPEQGGPLSPAQSLTILRADTNSGYYAVRALHQQLDVIRVEAGL